MCTFSLAMQTFNEDNKKRLFDLEAIDDKSLVCDHDRLALTPHCLFNECDVIYEEGPE